MQRRRHAPSAARNAGPITEALAQRLPAGGRALEVASGTGQHIVTFAARLPDIDWQPSDADPAARASVEAWVTETGACNVRPPLDLDVTREAWWQPVAPGLDAVVAVNLLHVAPWEATEGLLAGAARLLAPQGLLIVYGCFRRGGAHLSDSNAAFDRSLVAHDRRWGVRDVDEVAAAARERGLGLAEVVSMPANNLLLVLCPAPSGTGDGL